MTATNHALTGATIGLLIGNPLIALPVAFMSHFVCDAIPHFGLQDPRSIGGSNFGRMLLVDASLCVGLVALLFVNQPQHWLLASLCAFAATSPDLMWIGKFRRARQGQPDRPMRSAVMRLHSGIQWFQRPIGALVEVAWFVGLGTIVLTLLSA